jgi:hypothetical protein
MKNDIKILSGDFSADFSGDLSGNLNYKNNIIFTIQ